MDPNPSNGNNTSPGYLPPPYVSPLYEALLPFYHPENTCSPVPPEMHHGSSTPMSANWNYPDVPQITTGQAPVANHPADYLMNNFILDTSTNINPNNFIANYVQSSGPGENDPNMHIFQCEKCPAKFYSRQAFGGHMSSHSKKEKRSGNMSQKMMAKIDNSKNTAAGISGMNEGADASASATSKKRGRKKGKNVVIDELKAKKQV
jgi:hypothetical protein